MEENGDAAQREAKVKELLSRKACKSGEEYLDLEVQACKGISPPCEAGTQYQSHPPTQTSNRLCHDISQCNYALEYEIQPPSSTSDRDCAAITVCASNEHELKPPTKKSDRICKLGAPFCLNLEDCVGHFFPEGEEQFLALLEFGLVTASDLDLLSDRDCAALHGTYPRLFGKMGKRCMDLIFSVENNALPFEEEKSVKWLENNEFGRGVTAEVGIKKLELTMLTKIGDNRLRPSTGETFKGYLDRIEGKLNGMAKLIKLYWETGESGREVGTGTLASARFFIKRINRLIEYICSKAECKRHFQLRYSKSKVDL